MLDAIVVDTAEKHEALYKAEVLARSQGTLNDFSIGSILKVFAETYGLGFSKLELQSNEKITEVVFSSIAKLLGATDFEGVKARITLEFLPVNIDTINALRISAGYRVEINGAIFETTQELNIPPGGFSSRVIAECTEIGTQGNVIAGSVVNYAPVDNLRSISVVAEPLVYGKDRQTYQDVTVNLTQNFINKALVTTSDYQAILTAIYPNLVFKAVPNLASDKITKINGTMHIFVMQNNASFATAEQKRNIVDALKEGWATVYVSDFSLYNFKISAIVRVIPGAELATVANAIAAKLKDFYSPLNTINRRDIDLYDTVGLIYGIDNVDVANGGVGYVSFDNGDGQWQAIDIPMPNVYTIPKLDSVKVTFTTGEEFNV